MAKKKKQRIAVLLDQSGSMGVVRDATISGLNEYVETLQQEKSVKALFSLVMFNGTDGVVTVADNVPLKDAPRLTEGNYRPSGSTPLYDAIGRTIEMMEKSLNGANEDVLFVIQTDGEENASQEYNTEAIRQRIQVKEKDGWTFAYFGADQDAWASIKDIGLRQSNVMSYASADTQGAFVANAQATVKHMRQSYSGRASRSFYDDNSQPRR